MGAEVKEVAALLIALAISSPVLDVDVGVMHKVLGGGQDQARVTLAEVVAMDHVFAVGALAELAGEVTIVDSEVFATTVTSEGTLDASAVTSATMLFGDVVEAWNVLEITEDVAPESFGTYLGDHVDVDPVVFTADGRFVDVRLHVIHGACPVHAARNGIELAPEDRPFVVEFDHIEGRVVGIFARDAVGRLTHPGVPFHAHLVFDDPATGRTVTGHLERIGVAAGAKLALPRRD